MMIFDGLCLKRGYVSMLRLVNYSALLSSSRRDQRIVQHFCSKKDDDDDGDKEASTADQVPTKSRRPSTAMSAELLQKILSMKVSGSTTSKHDAARPVNFARPTGKWSTVKKKIKEDFDKEQKLNQEGLSREVVSAVKDVANNLGGDTTKTETDLIRRLKEQHVVTELGKTGVSFSVSDVIAGMKIDRTQSRREMTGSSVTTEKDMPALDKQQTRDTNLQLHQFPSTQSWNREHRRVADVDLFGAPLLNIFTAKTEAVPKKLSSLNTWDKLSQHELELLTLHPPSNGFEEMITWTKQGKLWRFPIDNEQGMEEEAKVGFHEHIFLEVHLEKGFPKTGPIRHFMELVVIGLSKNPFMNVQQKLDHIDWFRNYFSSKDDILKEVGAIE